MSPEKDIVNVWLNRRGFFTVNDLNAGRNKIVSILALKYQKEKPHILHVEISCSISPSPVLEREKEDLIRKFYDLNVTQKISAYISDFFGGNYDYEKLLVTTKEIELNDIKTIHFEKVLADVVAGLDRQNYRNQVTRTMQLMKYLLLARPAEISEVLGKDRETKTLTTNSREKLVKAIITQSSSIKIFRKKGNEDLLIHMLKNSSLKNPEKLAKALDEVLTPRTANRFLNVLLKQKNLQKAIRTREKRLEEFLEQ